MTSIRREIVNALLFLAGIEEFTAITIVSSAGAGIRDGIVDEMGRGVTVYTARGGKTGEERDVLYCVGRRDRSNLDGENRRVGFLWCPHAARREVRRALTVVHTGTSARITKLSAVGRRDCTAESRAALSESRAGQQERLTELEGLCREC